MPLDHRPVVYFHIMKCGGSSVRSALSAAVPGGRDGPDVFELDGHAAKAAAGGSVAADWAFRDALLSYVAQALRPAVILGHFRYREQHASALGDAHLVTVLRDPVERVISLYRYRRFGAGIDLPISVTLEEQIASGRWAIEGHRYVSTFSGRDDLDPRTPEAIDAAVTNLRRFAAVGAVDRLDAFAGQLSKLIGRRISVPLLNASPAPEPTTRSEIDAGVVAQIRDLSAADRQVYERIIDRAAG